MLPPRSTLRIPQAPQQTVAITQHFLVRVTALAFLCACDRAPAQAGDRVRLQGANAGATAGPSHCCTVTSVDSSVAIVTARETASGYTFRFTMRDAKQLRALKLADKVWADFTRKTVRLSEGGSDSCCTILAGPLP